MAESQTKILYLVTQSDFGGAQRYVFDLASNFSQKYAIIVAGGEQGHQGELTKRLKEKNIEFRHLSHLKRAISPLHDWLAFWQIVKLIKKEKPNIIHLNSSKISILGSLAAQYVSRIISYKLYVIYTVHGWIFNEELSAGKKYFYLWCERFTARFKDKIICLSEFDKQNAIKQKIEPAKKISVIHNGIKPINFLSKEEAREKLNIPQDAVAIGTIGNLYKNKGYQHLIKAFKILNIKYLILNIIGEGPESKNLKSEILNLKLDKKIMLIGNIPSAASLLSAFNIYICSSIKEGLPYSILEAMQAGLPIVSTNVGAIPEVIADKKSGLLVEPKNPDRLAKKIKYLIDNPEVAKRLGENAKEKVKEFSLEKMLEKTEELYEM